MGEVAAPGNGHAPTGHLVARARCPRAPEPVPPGRAADRPPLRGARLAEVREGRDALARAVSRRRLAEAGALDSVRRARRLIRSSATWLHVARILRALTTALLSAVAQDEPRRFRAQSLVIGCGRFPGELIGATLGHAS